MISAQDVAAQAHYVAHVEDRDAVTFIAAVIVAVAVMLLA